MLLIQGYDHEKNFQHLLFVWHSRVIPALKSNWQLLCTSFRAGFSFFKQSMISISVDLVIVVPPELIFDFFRYFEYLPCLTGMDIIMENLNHVFIVVEFLYFDSTAKSKVQIFHRCNMSCLIRLNCEEFSF